MGSRSSAHQDLSACARATCCGDAASSTSATATAATSPEQADFSFLYPINDTWSVVGRYYYSLLDNKTLESLAGVQWESCCLAVRLLARRYLRNRSGDLNNALQVEFELKGLGSAGQDTAARSAPCYPWL